MRAFVTSIRSETRHLLECRTYASSRGGGKSPLLRGPKPRGGRRIHGRAEQPREYTPAFCCSDRLGGLGVGEYCRDVLSEAFLPWLQPAPPIKTHLHLNAEGLKDETSVVFSGY